MLILQVTYAPTHARTKTHTLTGPYLNLSFGVSLLLWVSSVPAERRSDRMTSTSPPYTLEGEDTQSDIPHTHTHLYTHTLITPVTF